MGPPDVVPDIGSVDEAWSAFLTPPLSARPTPLYWWSGADLDRTQLEWQLDQLAARGIGGTIVGYSHLPDGSLDHGDPKPFTAEWWDLFRWFVDAAAQRGMTTGIQDYGIIGTVLKSVAGTTSGRNAGTLSHHELTVAAVNADIETVCDGQIVSAIAWPALGSHIDAVTLNPLSLDSDDDRWVSRSGEWKLSIVAKTRGHIGLDDTDFDPMHPRSGAAVIEAFYSLFERELGEQFGRNFRMFFQDELDLGITMPMWNDQVAATLQNFFPGIDVLQAIWLDVGGETARVRTTYRDIVVGLLVDNYFRPIFEWLDDRGVVLVMDQISRGDLRLGHHHYADFMETMHWYHGPGNDDPDLHAPRNTAAFAVSASIARIGARPLVVNEAFHSSGWDVSPSEVIAGLNVGFVSGANHVVMHGLNYTTQGGWWEWASPDFHFRQPWWPHSTDMWDYVARISALLRCGLNAAEIAIVDPTIDLCVNPATQSPEIAHRLLTEMRSHGRDIVVAPESVLSHSSVSNGEMEVGKQPIVTIVLPAMTSIRDETLSALTSFVSSGGTVIAVQHLPLRTETRTVEAVDTLGWTVVATVEAAIALVGPTQRSIQVTDNMMVTRRRLNDGDIFLVVNPTDAVVTASVTVPATMANIKQWDPWTLSSRSFSLAPGEGSTLVVPITLRAGGATVLVSRDSPWPYSAPEGPSDFPHISELSSLWTVEVAAGLDNRFGDFADDDRSEVGVESVRCEIETAASASALACADVGTRFHVLGPIKPANAKAAERLIVGAEPDLAGLVSIGGRELRWRPYDFSPGTGIDRDPLLLDRMTGPHGLKGVIDDFLDPTVYDDGSVPGDLYYFLSRVATPDSSEVVHAGSRSPFTVWLDGNLVLEQSAEEPSATFEPWSLQDRRIEQRSVTVQSPAPLGVVVLKVAVAHNQPTRAFVAVGGDGGMTTSVTRLRWWAGSFPARPFQPLLGKLSSTTSTRLRFTIPPGARAATITALGPVTSAQIGNEELTVRGDESGTHRGEPKFSSVVDLPAGSVGVLRVTVTSMVDLGGTAGVLVEPVRWVTERVSTPISLWADWGLTDFSGRIRYTQLFDWDVASERVALKIDGLEGSAAITLNGQPVGFLFESGVTEDVSGLIRRDGNVLVVECANTLGNYYGRRPTPFARPNETRGGFTSASLVWA